MLNWEVLQKTDESLYHYSERRSVQLRVSSADSKWTLSWLTALFVQFVAGVWVGFCHCHILELDAFLFMLVSEWRLILFGCWGPNKKGDNWKQWGGINRSEDRQQQWRPGAAAVWDRPSVLASGDLLLLPRTHLSWQVSQGSPSWEEDGESLAHPLYLQCRFGARKPEF